MKMTSVVTVQVSTQPATQCPPPSSTKPAPRRRKAASGAVARRNERERNRVRQVNMGFQTLRQHVPNKSKKMSKVETLRSAVQYIKQLRMLLGECDEGGGSNGRQSPASSSLGSDADSLSPEDEELLDFAAWLAP